MRAGPPGSPSWPRSPGLAHLGDSRAGVGAAITAKYPFHVRLLLPAQSLVVQHLQSLRRGDKSMGVLRSAAPLKLKRFAHQRAGMHAMTRIQFLLSLTLLSLT